MPKFDKPSEGSWTQHFPQLGTGPISYEDSISPEHYELERRAIFERTWLNVGRVEQLPKPGSYFTKDLDVARTSLIIARGLDGEVRAFHNICRHRGNKLVWQDYPDQETQGVGRQFTCKYHGWRYGTDGACTFVQQESEFFDFDKADHGLVPVHLDVWEGFIFVNLDKATPQPLRDYLGAFAAGLDGYPFGAMTQVHKYRADVHANWKLYIDAFAEFYHAPVLHSKQYTEEEARKLSGYGYEGLHYDLDGPHGMQSTWGGMAPPKDPSMVKPIERVLRSGNFGAWDRPDIPGLDPLPAGINPSRHKSWGLDSFVFFPNFMIVVWAPGWYLTYHYWPTAYNRHTFEGTLYFVPPANARERMRQELAAVTFKEFGLQDCNTLEATQRMLESRAVTEFPLNDQEIMLRHLHQTAGDYVARYQQERRPPAPRRTGGGVTAVANQLPPAFEDLEPWAEWALPTEPERYAKRLASTFDELQAFYDAAFPRLEDAAAYLEQLPLDDLPLDATRLLQVTYSLINISFPIEAWRQPRCPTAAHRCSTVSSNRRSRTTTSGTETPHGPDPAPRPAVRRRHRRATREDDASWRRPDPAVQDVRQEPADDRGDGHVGGLRTQPRSECVVS